MARGSLRPAGPGDVDTIVALARATWPAHYDPFLAAGQADYMLRTVHSPAKIREEVATGSFTYHLIESGGRDVGYVSWRAEDGALFLSKVYVLSSERGKGLGRLALDAARSAALDAGLAAVRLTVNKGNTGAIAAYETIGFRKTEEIRIDIGGGYVMDDHVMRWDLRT